MDLYSLLRTYKRPLIFLVVICVLLIGGWFGYDFWRSKNYATLLIEGAPEDLTMTMNDKDYKSPHKIYVKPGEYSLYFFRENFTDARRKVNAEKGKKLTVLVPLYAANEEGKKYLLNNPGVMSRLELIGSRYENEQTNLFMSKYPVVKLLPVLRRDFKIDYSSTGLDTERKVYIRVTYAGKTGKKNAETWFTDNGFNASDYDVSFVDITKIPKGHD